MCSFMHRYDEDVVYKLIKSVFRFWYLYVEFAGLFCLLFFIAFFLFFLLIYLILFI